MNGEAVEAFFLLDLQGTEADEARPDKPETGDAKESSYRRSMPYSNR